jgi:SAM-dependent methyltransferase
MLHAALPEAELTACDVNRDGVDFCASQFGATPVYAPTNPQDLEIKDRFDLIWVGSLFTHFDRDRWAALLDKLSELLAGDGLLVFSTLGEQSPASLRLFNLGDEAIAGLLEDFKRDGFGYYGFPSMEDWGITLTSPEYVREQVAQRPELDLIHFVEGGWAPPTPGHDVYTCIKRGGRTSNETQRKLG